MNTASLGIGSLQAPSVLCLGAHCDDIEIGCGGTLMKLAAECPKAQFEFVVFCSDDVRAAESRRAAERFLEGAADSRLRFFEFRDGYLPYEGQAVKDALRSVAESVSPDLVFTHYRHDGHQDHRLVAEITTNLFRDHMILEYEIPKYDGDLGRPNAYFPLDEGDVSRKTDILLDCFASQRGRSWFTEETFRSLLRLRGIESGSTGDYAEAFFAHKLVVGP